MANYKPKVITVQICSSEFFWIWKDQVLMPESENKEEIEIYACQHCEMLNNMEATTEICLAL